MKITVKNVKKALKETIKSIDVSKKSFCNNPNADFTRKRKISFMDIIKFQLTKSGESLNCELMNYFDFKDKLPSTSAFIQQRDKISHLAFETLFHQFTDCCYEEKLFKCFRLLAIDGSDLRVPVNPNEKASYIDYVGDSKTYNLLHLNALFDLQRKIYVDAIVQPRKGWNEHRAFTDMIIGFDIFTLTDVVAIKCSSYLDVIEEESLSEFISPNYDDIEENTDVEYVQDSDLKNVIAMKPKTKRKMS